MAVKTSERLILRLHEDRKIPLFAPRPNGSLTSENWQKPYADALMEVQPHRLSRLIVEAERAITRGIKLDSWLTLVINRTRISLKRTGQDVPRV